MAKDRKGREFASLAEACTYAVRRAPGLLRKILRLDANTYLSTEISDGERTPLSGGASDKKTTTSLIQLQTTNFRQFGCALKTPLLHLQNTKEALRRQKPIEWPQVAIFQHGQWCKTLSPNSVFHAF
jgi:hypothetical protein